MSTHELFGEGITEVIATTVSKDGKRNAAPIGIIRTGDELYARLFRGSTTLANVAGTGLLAANIVDDPVLFVRALLDDILPDEFIETDGHPVLANSCAAAVFRCECEEEGDPVTVRLSPLLVKINRRRVFRVNRGFNAVIEAAVHATRYVIFHDERLKKCIDHYAAIARKCGGAREHEAMVLIYEFMGRKER